MGIQICFLVAVLCSVNIMLVKAQVPNKSFIRSCRNETLLQHEGINNHSYCNHSCDGRKNQEIKSECKPSGVCVCSRECSQEAVAVNTPKEKFGDYCLENDMVDPEYQQYKKKCDGDCSALCPNRYGAICGENGSVRPPTYVRVCTCRCPRSMCTPITTTTAATTTEISTNHLHAATIQFHFLPFAFNALIEITKITYNSLSPVLVVAVWKMAVLSYIMACIVPLLLILL